MEPGVDVDRVDSELNRQRADLDAFRACRLKGLEHEMAKFATGHADWASGMGEAVRWGLGGGDQLREGRGEASGELREGVAGGGEEGQLEGVDFFENGIQLNLEMFALLFELNEFLEGFDSVIIGEGGVGAEGGTFFRVGFRELDG